MPGDEIKPTEETVGPIQYGGEDEPGQDANRRFSSDAVPTQIQVKDAEEIVKPGKVMPSSDMTEDEWRAKNWPNAEPDSDIARHKAEAGTLDRELAVSFREDADEYTQQGKENMAKSAFRAAERSDKTADEKEERAADDYKLERGLPVSDKKVKERQAKLLENMEDIFGELKETIAAYRKLLEDYKGNSVSQSEISDIPAANKPDGSHEN